MHISLDKPDELCSVDIAPKKNTGGNYVQGNQKHNLYVDFAESELAGLYTDEMWSSTIFIKNCLSPIVISIMLGVREGFD